MSIIQFIFPVFQEQNNINALLKKLDDQVKSTKHLYFVYDYDEDPTVSIILELKDQYSNIYIKLIKNNGTGVLQAIKTGIENVNVNYPTCISMADLSDDYLIIDQAISEMKLHNLKTIYFNRNHKVNIKNFLSIKFLLSFFASFLTFHFSKLKINDVTNAYRLFNTNSLKSYKIESNLGFSLSIELAYLDLKNKNKYLQINVKPNRTREEGKSKFKIMSWLPAYLKYFFKIIFIR